MFPIRPATRSSVLALAAAALALYPTTRTVGPTRPRGGKHASVKRGQIPGRFKRRR